MDDRAAEVLRWAVAYPAGVVVAAVAAGAVVGFGTAVAFGLTVVAAGVGLVALHDPNSPRRRALEDATGGPVEDTDGDDGPAGDGAPDRPGAGADPLDEEPKPGTFDDRSRRLLLFATGLFVLAWFAVAVTV